MVVLTVRRIQRDLSWFSQFPLTVGRELIEEINYTRTYRTFLCESLDAYMNFDKTANFQGKLVL